MSEIRTMCHLFLPTADVLNEKLHLHNTT